MSVKKVSKSATVMIHPQKQNADSVHRIVGRLLSMAGCTESGRLARLKLDFLSDPPPEFGRENVISLERQGF